MKRYLVELDDVRVAEELHVLNLAANLGDDVEVLDLLTVQNLDRDLVTGDLVRANLHLPEGADAERFAEDVMPDLDQRLAAFFRVGHDSCERTLTLPGSEEQFFFSRLLKIGNEHPNHA